MKIKVKVDILCALVLVSCVGCVSQEQQARREQLMSREIELTQREKSLKSREATLDCRWNAVCNKPSSMTNGFETVMVIKDVKDLYDEFSGN